MKAKGKGEAIPTIRIQATRAGVPNGETNDAQMTRHVFGPVMPAARIVPEFCPPPGSRSMFSDLHQLAQKGPARPSRLRLGALIPHFVLPPILYAPLSLVASCYYTLQLFASLLPSRHHADPNTERKAVTFKVSYVLTATSNSSTRARTTTSSSARSTAVLQCTRTAFISRARRLFVPRRFWFAWYSARRAASVDIDRESLCPENRSNAVGGSAVTCASRFVTTESRRLCCCRQATARVGSSSFPPSSSPCRSGFDFPHPGRNPCDDD